MLKKVIKETENRDSQNKIPLFAISLFISLVVGIIIITNFQLKQEKKDKKKDVLNKGVQLINLISLHPIKDFNNTDRRDFFFRNLVRSSSDSGLVYCYVHDQTGKVVASLITSDLVHNSPNEIKVRSLSSRLLIKQTFYESGSGKTVYEYSKPIFENNRKSGTVRIGLTVPDIVLFKLERLSQLSILVLFMFATIVIFYYGIIYVMRPVKNIVQNFKKISYGSVPENGHSEKDINIANMAGELNHSFLNIQERLNKVETENIELSTKMGAVIFDKDQVVNLLDSLNFGIITTDLHDNINYINEYIRNLLGLERENVLDQPLDKIIENDDIASYISRFETIETARNGKNIETTFPNLSPEEVFGVSFYNLADKVGEAIGKMILIKNITIEKMGEETQLEFISYVSHELLTPLTTIKSYNEMLMDGDIDKEEMQKEFYNTINDETARLSSLIQNLLNLSKIETGSLTINKELVRTELLFEDCANAIDASALKKNIGFEKNLPDKFPSLYGDKELLKVVINSVLNNAVKYTPEGGNITFSLYEYNNNVTFDVVNTGCGISKEDRLHIFDKSYRSTDKHVTEQSGSGLGLAIASKIVNLHGGDIDVQSEPGKETCFKINIPKEEYYLEDK